MFLGLDRLLEDRFPSGVLLAHGLGGSFHVIKHLRLDGRSVCDDRASFDVDLENGVAARTSYFEIGDFVRHLSE